MSNPIELDKSFQEFMSDLPRWAPEGIVEVNLELLEQLGLLHPEEFETTTSHEQLPHYFHVIETNEKVTLFNHQFCIWIVPKLVDEVPITIVLISLLSKEKPHLELVYSTRGVYNTPKFVLKILKHFLTEVIDNEDAISSIKNAS